MGIPGSRFRDRAEAGRVLASRLAQYADRPDTLVLGLPRGGVPVAYEVARALRAPLDVFVVRKLGIPGYEELAMGAIATGGVCVLNEDLVDYLQLSADVIEEAARRERRVLQEREQLYRGERPAPDVRDKIVIVTDDGLATGSTMRAAVEALREQGPRRIVVAVPLAAPQVCDELAAQVDEVVCAATPEPFYAVGMWYDDFAATSDEQVRELLARADARTSAEPLSTGA
jgi:predicted phosphoribosyltransferase